MRSGRFVQGHEPTLQQHLRFSALLAMLYQTSATLPNMALMRSCARSQVVAK